MAQTKTILAEDVEGRLDKFLAGALKPLTRAYIQKLISRGLVTVNGRAVPARQPVLCGDRIEVSQPDFSGLPASAAKSVPVLFEDKDLVVLNKPAGLVVHPAGPHQTDTLIQRLWPKLAPAWGRAVKGTSLHTARPGVVHRLDRGTSGVMVIAKTPAAAQILSRQFEKRQVKKTYWAVVEGQPETDAGVIQSTVGRDRRKPHRMSTTDPGKPSELSFKVLKRFSAAGGGKGHALLEVTPKTGRTHQIRVQLSAVGLPLAGDETYGAATGGQGRPFLHAHALSFKHPRTKKPLAFSVPPPADFRALLARLTTGVDKS